MFLKYFGYDKNKIIYFYFTAQLTWVEQNLYTFHLYVGWGIILHNIIICDSTTMFLKHNWLRLLLNYTGNLWYKYRARNHVILELKDI